MKLSAICLVVPALLTLGIHDGGLIEGVEADEIPAASSALQRFIDSLCLETFARACEDNPHFCTTAVARRGVGSNASEGEAWRCYSTTDVDFSLTAKCCVDDCGELIECQGSTKEGSLEHLSPTEALEQLLQDVQDGTCKIHKKATSI